MAFREQEMPLGPGTKKDGCFRRLGKDLKNPGGKTPKTSVPGVSVTTRPSPNAFAESHDITGKFQDGVAVARYSATVTGRKEG